MTDLEHESVFPFVPPARLDGIGCYHPNEATNTLDFPEHAFEHLIQIEDGHFWFESRNSAIHHLVSTYLPATDQTKSFLEIGCGTGFVLRMLSQMPGIRAAGAEIHLAGAKFAQSRVPPTVEVVQLDAFQMTFASAFDAIGVFDVIEHLDDDVGVLRKIHEALKPGGICFASVPQHAWLWSPQDEMAGHKRRYSRRMLTDRLAAAGLEIQYVTSFCFIVMPLFAASRLKKKRLGLEEAKKQLMSEVTLSPATNRLLKAMLKIDLACIRRGLRLPCGGSLLAVARRPA